MNREFIMDGNKVIVYDDNGKHERESRDNIEKILETENNIEEIRNLIELNDKNMNFLKSRMKIASLDILIVILWSISFLGNVLSGNTFSAVCNAICIACWTGSAFFKIKPHLKDLKIAKIKNSVLGDELIEERKKLIELEKNKENNSNYINRIQKELSPSEQIINLQHKLEIIQDYENNKKIYLKHYKNNTLEAIVYRAEDIDFIKELIEMDLNINIQEENTKSNQKTLK